MAIPRYTTLRAVKNTVGKCNIKLLAVREYGPNFVKVFTFIVTPADPICNVGDQIGLLGLKVVLTQKFWLYIGLFIHTGY